MRNFALYLGLVLVILAVLGIQLSGIFQLQKMSEQSSTQPYVAVNTLINYGNTTSRWHNMTNVPANWNFYELTNNITRVEATYYASVNEHFVKAIDGVRSTGRAYWTLWLYCQKNQSWIASSVGADLLTLANGDTFAWFYQAPSSPDPSAWQPPVAGARTTSTC